MIKENIKKSVYDNIRQYNMESQILDNVICDIAHHPWRNIEIWDAIVCDVSSLYFHVFHFGLIDILMHYFNCLSRLTGFVLERRKSDTTTTLCRQIHQ